MRILLATDAFPPKIDGVADTAAIVTRHLVERGHTVDVLAPGPGPGHLSGATVHRQASVGLPFYPDVRATVPFAAARHAFSRRRPDACIVLTPGPVGLAVVRARPAGMPFVNIYTTDMPRYLRSYGMGLLGGPMERLLRWMNRAATVTLCPTAYVRDELAARGHVRLEVWGRGVDRALFNPGRQSAVMRDRLAGGEPGKPLVLYVGRLAREKRLADLYHAARRVGGMRFAIVGDGPQRETLERRFSEVPTVFTGFLRGEALAEAFASADIFAFPSDTETFGQVVLQAMASGLPPIVPRGTAPAEMAADGIAGLQVAPRDPAALAGALERLAGDLALRERLGAGAGAVAARHSWPALVDRLETWLQVPAGRPEPVGASV